MANKIKWIFFDVGGVIVNDDYYLTKYYRYLFERIKKQNTEITKREFKETHQEVIDEYHSSIAKALLNRLVRDGNIRKEIRKEVKEKLRKEYDKLMVLKNDIKEILKALKKEGYKLGLIGNQEREVINFLRKHNLWKLFDFKGISEILGLRKPDLRIFKLALRRRCKPKEAIMVGDRIDNDIIPAKKLGMKTIRIRKGSFEHRHQKPRNESEKASITIESINQLLEAIKTLTR